MNTKERNSLLWLDKAVDKIKENGTYNKDIEFCITQSIQSVEYGLETEMEHLESRISEIKQDLDVIKLLKNRVKLAHNE